TAGCYGKREKGPGERAWFHEEPGCNRSKHLFHRRVSLRGRSITFACFDMLCRAIPGSCQALHTRRIAGKHPRHQKPIGAVGVSGRNLAVSCSAVSDFVTREAPLASVYNALI